MCWVLKGANFIVLSDVDFHIIADVYFIKYNAEVFSMKELRVTQYLSFTGPMVCGPIVSPGVSLA